MDIHEGGARRGVFIETNPIAHLMVMESFVFLKKIWVIMAEHAIWSELLKKLDKKISGDVAAEIENLY